MSQSYTKTNSLASDDLHRKTLVKQQPTSPWFHERDEVQIIQTAAHKEASVNRALQMARQAHDEYSRLTYSLARDHRVMPSPLLATSPANDSLRSLVLLPRISPRDLDQGQQILIQQNPGLALDTSFDALAGVLPPEVESTSIPRETTRVEPRSKMQVKLLKMSDPLRLCDLPSHPKPRKRVKPSQSQLTLASRRKQPRVKLQKNLRLAHNT